MGTRRDLSSVDTLVIHCSATPNGQPFTIEDIDQWHGKRNPPFRRDMSIAPKWQPELRHVGYHLVIETDGAVRAGRPFQESGAHAAGHNHNSIGVCMIGTDKFTEAQWQALFAVALFVTHPGNDLDGLNVSSVVGHRDLSPDLDGDGEVEPHEWLKTCPGFSVSDWLANDCKPLPDHVLEG